MAADLCYACDLPHPHGRPHRYRVPCPDGRRGCAVARYGPVDPRALTAARDRVVEAAKEKHRMETLEVQWVTRKIEHGVYQTTDHVAANSAFAAAVDALRALEAER